MKVSASGGGDFQRTPAGVHVCRCYRVIDLGTQRTEWQGKEKKARKVILTWELVNEKMDDGRPFTINQRYTASLGENATLRKHLKSWRGRDFDAQELAEFDLKNVLGKPCLINIVHTDKGGKTYENIEAIMPIPTGSVAPALTNEIVHVSLDPDEFSPESFATLSDRLKETIISSPEFKALGGAVAHDEVSADEDWN